MAITTTLDDMIAEVQLELSFRARVYPRQVQTGSMKQDEATRRTKALADVQAVLQALQRSPNAIAHLGIPAKRPGALL
jgi:hypothetical protein